MAEADRLIRDATRPRLRAYWLDILLAAGLTLAGAAVWDAVHLPNEAAVVVNDLRKGELLDPKDVVYAPLRVSARNVTKGERVDQYVAARDVAAGSLLLRCDVAPRRPKPGEVEVALKLFVGRTPPEAGAEVLLAVVGTERGGPAVFAARILSVDGTIDPAYVTVAMAERQALVFAAIPQPQIQLMQRPPQEGKR